MERFERLQEARKDAGFDNATEAARAFGWNENNYRSHENGTRGFSRGDTAQKYADAFGVRVEWLMYERGKKREGEDLTPSEFSRRFSLLEPKVQQVIAGIMNTELGGKK